MKALPMIFNTETVQALMDGRKVQTRRPVKPQPAEGKKWRGWVIESSDRKNEGCASWADGEGCKMFNAEYARPPVMTGDLIYVRETFGVVSEEYGEYSPVYKDDNWLRPKKWTPSIHMPRELSRITLKVTSVRVERVQDISRNDCIAEGFQGGHGSIPGYMYSATPKEHFSETWKQIYGDHWKDNGWCWVIDFDVVLENVDVVISEMED